MISTMKRARHFLILIASVIPAMAHPPQFHAMEGIGATRVGFLHPISGLDHLLVMVAVGLWAVQIGGRALWALPCSFIGSMMLGGVVGLCETHLPIVEHGILASIILLGVSLCMAWQPPLLIAVICVGTAGLFHGYAHGSEMPSGATPILFFTGMVASTALLHTFGVAGGLLFRNQNFATLMRAAGLLLIAFAVYDFYSPV